MPQALAVSLAYLAGSFPTGFLLVKWMKRLDVRTIGSGNVGATNVARAAGWRASLVVFLIDAGKGVVAVLAIAPWLLPSPTGAQRLACGLAAVLGHNFPVWLGFKGGKGVATTIGVVLAAMPAVAGVVLIVWGLTFIIWRYASVSSIAAAVSIPLMQWAGHRSGSEVTFGLILAALIILRHRQNITRLLQGREHRVGTPRQAPGQRASHSS